MTPLVPLREFPVTTLADVLDASFEKPSVLLGMRSLIEGKRVAGYALPVQETYDSEGGFDVSEFSLGQVIDQIQPGQFVVFDNGDAPVSTLGGIAAFALARQGAAGICVNGGVRDVNEIRDTGLASFVRHIVPTSGKKRVRIDTVGETIEIQGVDIAAGDLIVADDTAVARIPKESALEVITDAQKLMDQDEMARAEIAMGMTFSDALNKYKSM